MGFCMFRANTVNLVFGLDFQFQTAILACYYGS